MIHSLDWGQYGDLQRGDYAKARDWIVELDDCSSARATRSTR